jgi:hypothetical protein
MYTCTYIHIIYLPAGEGGGGEAGLTTAACGALALALEVEVEVAEGTLGEEGGGEAGLGGGATLEAENEVEVGVEVEVAVDCLTSSFPTTDMLVCHSSNALNWFQRFESLKKHTKRQGDRGKHMW